MADWTRTEERMKKEDLYRIAGSAMTECQLIEEALKGYISEAYDLVRKSLASPALPEPHIHDDGETPKRFGEG
jgi:hypothetical protein